MKTHLNLLPQRALCRQALVSRIRIWLSLGCLAAAAAGTIGWRTGETSLLATRRRDQLEERYRPVMQAQAEVEQMRGEIARLRQEQRVALSLASDQPILTIVGLVSQAAASCEGQVVVQRLSFKSGESAAPGERLSARGLTVLGVARDNLAIARFAAALRDAGVFDHVDLKSTGAQQTADGAGHSYHLECAY